jgi:hypothetical protein
MPVTIGTLTSNVNLVDASAMPNPEMMENIIKTVIARLKEEDKATALLRQQQEIRTRMTQPEPD